MTEMIQSASKSDHLILYRYLYYLSNKKKNTALLVAMGETQGKTQDHRQRQGKTNEMPTSRTGRKKRLLKTSSKT